MMNKGGDGQSTAAIVKHSTVCFNGVLIALSK